jgi:hypothetical protein
MKMKGNQKHKEIKKKKKQKTTTKKRRKNKGLNDCSIGKLETRAVAIVFDFELGV